MLKVLSLFSGIGAFEVALDELEIDWKLDHYCEIDKYACQSYNCIHGTTDEDNLKDVTNIDYSKIGDIDLVTYGFPCQDISLAGNQKGFFDEDGNLTRSGLFFNAADVIRHTNPKFAIFENVKNLTGKKFKKEFETVLSTLDELGYNTYWKVLNAKDYGIPQNRERVFGISIRKDIDKGYTFPQGFELTLRLKDMLEEQVEEKYYLSQKGIEYFKKQAENRGENLHHYNDRRLLTLAHGQSKGSNKNDEICPTLDTQFSNNWHGVLLEPKRIGGLFDDEKGKHQAGSIWDTEHLSPTLDTMQGGYRQPCIMESMICASRGRNPNNPSSRKAGEPTEQRIEVNTKGLCNTLTTVQKDNLVLEPKLVGGIGEKNFGKQFRQGNRVYDSNEIAVCLTARPVGNAGGNSYLYQLPDFRIRKLTPRECWRLMGFRDYYFDKVKGISNTQLYKQAGNSIVVDVLKYIFEELHNQYPEYFSKDEWGSDL